MKREKFWPLACGVSPQMNRTAMVSLVQAAIPINRKRVECPCTAPLLASRVSVIVPTKNRRAFLAEALASIRALEGPDLKIELIVVDNGSTDGSQAVARSFDAIVLETLEQGAACARNLGMRAATGEFLAFLDDDDVWLEGHLRPQIALLRARPELSGAVGQIVLTDATLGDRQAPYPAEMAEDGNLFPAFLDRHPQLGATVVRTQVRDSVAPFDPDVEGGEDWDWHLRLALDHALGFTPVPCMLFRQRPIGATAEQQWRRLRTARRIFTRNVVRAGMRGPNAMTSARSFLRHNGHYCAYFIADARGRSHKAEPGVTTALVRAFLCSPPHALAAVVREAGALFVQSKARGLVGAPPGVGT